jgi:putative transposase
VLIELQRRSLEDIMIASLDGLKGFSDKINAVFSQNHVQLCIVHMLRNSLKYPIYYSTDIYKAIYMNNAIVSLNSVIRKALKKCKTFPSHDSAKKMVYLAITEASKKWTMLVQNWR